MSFNKLLDFPIKNYVFCLVSSLLILIIVITQIKIWGGEHNYFGLQDLRQEITSLKEEKNNLQDKNNLLIEEKAKLSSGRDGVEGLARLELGLIKPGEKFYIFSKEEKSEVVPKIAN
jgi:cell division protein FtsB